MTGVEFNEIACTYSLYCMYVCMYVPLYVLLANAVTSVEVNEMACTLLSMNFFDRLQSNGI